MSGLIEYSEDTSWNSPFVTLANATQWRLIDYNYISTGLAADLSGQQVIFLDTMNHWVPLISRTAALRICQIIGNDNVSVNYMDSFSPYYGKLVKACSFNSVDFVPVSVCIGTSRLSIELDEERKELRFATVPPLTQKRVPKIPPIVYSLCCQPADHTCIPSVYRFPGKATVIDFLSPLFPDKRSMLTYLWAIGNCIRDPVARPRCTMLCGPGGGGKSTAIRMAMAALSGTCSVIPDNILANKSSSVADKIAYTVIKSRLVTCFELDLDNTEVNMSMFKNITGGDYVKADEFMARATCSFVLATNGLPNITSQPEFTSDAISRRMLCIKMNVDTSTAPFEPDPSKSIDKVDFLCACIYVRCLYPYVPISPDDLLVTLCGNLYFEAVGIIEVAPTRNTSLSDCRLALSYLCGVLRCPESKVVGRCRLISPPTVQNTVLGPIVVGIRPRSGAPGSL